MLTKTFWVLLFGAIAGVAWAQSPPEVSSVENFLFNKLHGSFDNEPQLYLAAELGSPDLAGMTRRHLVVTELERKEESGARWFRLDVHRGGSREPISGSAWYRFEAAEDFAGVQMWRHGAAPSGSAGQNVTAPFDRCRFIWRQLAAGVRGEFEGGRCRTDAGWREEEWVLDGAGLSRRVRVFDTRGRLLEGRADGVAERFSRAHSYECFVALERPNGERFVKNPFTMHDGGDVWRFDPEGQEPPRYWLMLRNSLWPSRSGRNFLPLLHLDVFEEGREMPIGAGWAEPKSDRIGFNFIGGSARCKRQ